MVKMTTVSTAAELEQILDCKTRTLPGTSSNTEMETQGFVTMIHDLNVLQQMHNLAPSIIAKENERVAGYALVMLRECRQLFPPLEPMFASFDDLTFDGRPLNDYRFYVMGQVCIDKQYRRTGLFDALYQKHREIYSNEYDFILTEVSMRNGRSLRAHERVGFQTINIYKDEIDEWAVILWDWQ